MHLPGEEEEEEEGAMQEGKEEGERERNLARYDIMSPQGVCVINYPSS